MNISASNIINQTSDGPKGPKMYSLQTETASPGIIRSSYPDAGDFQAG